MELYVFFLYPDTILRSSRVGLSSSLYFCDIIYFFRDCLLGVLLEIRQLLLSSSWKNNSRYIVVRKYHIFFERSGYSLLRIEYATEGKWVWIAWSVKFKWVYRAFYSMLQICSYLGSIKIWLLLLMFYFSYLFILIL